MPGVRWLVAADWRCTHPDAIAYESFALNFTDLLCSVDAIVTKPGYGTFTEAAANGTPVLYQRRDDWPEQECLIEWLQRNAAVSGDSGRLPAIPAHCGKPGSALGADGDAATFADRRRRSNCRDLPVLAEQAPAP